MDKKDWPLIWLWFFSDQNNMLPDWWEVQSLEHMQLPFTQA